MAKGQPKELNEDGNVNLWLGKEAPAMTIVAAWIKADYGVEPSIAPSDQRVWESNIL